MGGKTPHRHCVQGGSSARTSHDAAPASCDVGPSPPAWRGWENDGFNLPAVLRDALASFTGEQHIVVMHNDAVVQGLSETPAMRDVKHWGVLAVGTGLGNARFTNRSHCRDGD